MANEHTLGRTLYAFREDRKISQSRLEVEAGLSFGTISRIENGLVNPTKETLTKIGNILQLTQSEFSYLININGEIPNEKNVLNVTKKTIPTLSQSQFPAFLMDCRFRIWEANTLFLHLFETNYQEVEHYKGENLLRLLFSPQLNIKNRIPKTRWPSLLKQQIQRYRYFTYHYRNEEFTRNELRYLRQHVDFKVVWDSADDDLVQSVTDDFYLKFRGKTLSIEIISTPLKLDNRFILVKYYPKDLQTAEVFEKLRRGVGDN